MQDYQVLTRVVLPLFMFFYMTLCCFCDTNGTLRSCFLILANFWKQKSRRLDDAEFKRPQVPPFLCYKGHTSSTLTPKKYYFHHSNSFKTFHIIDNSYMKKVKMTAIPESIFYLLFLNAERLLSMKPLSVRPRFRVRWNIFCISSHTSNKDLFMVMISTDCFINALNVFV